MPAQRVPNSLEDINFKDVWDYITTTNTPPQLNSFEKVFNHFIEIGTLSESQKKAFQSKYIVFCSRFNNNKKTLKPQSYGIIKRKEESRNAPNNFPEDSKFENLKISNSNFTQSGNSRPNHSYLGGNSHLICFEKFYFVYDSHEKTAKADMTPEAKEAYEYLLQVECYPVRISEKRLTESILKNPLNLFIVTSFEHSFVKQITDAGGVVTQCYSILYIKKYPTIGLAHQPTPYQSLCMAGLWVTTTGFTTAQKKVLAQKIVEMGGNYSDNLRPKTTVLIADNVTSEKYHNACGRIAIVDVKWLYQCVEVYQKELRFANEAAILKTHALPCFHKLVVSVSGFELAEREEFQKMIVDNGGYYSKDLSIKCDVLISAPAPSQKCKFAIKKKMEILRKHWLYDSIKAGYALSPEKYSMSFDHYSNPLSSLESAANSSRGISESTQSKNGSPAGKNPIDIPEAAPMLAPDEWFAHYTASSNAVSAGNGISYPRASTAKSSSSKGSNSTQRSVPETQTMPGGRSRNDFFNVSSSSDWSNLEQSYDKSQKYQDRTG